MPLAEVFIGAFITVLFEKLASSDLWNLARSEGIDSQLKKWHITLSQIRAVLVDAEQKQVTHEGVHDWLHHLQDLAYDIDDVLDDLATEALRRKLTIKSEASTSTSTSSSSKVWKFIPTCCTSFTPRNFMYGREISSKLDDITERLQHLLSIKSGLGLSVNVEKPVNVSRRETTSLFDASGVLGRDEDKEILLKKLLQEETCDGNVGVVPIVGMGGIGKTTLAKLLYNHNEVKDHFELRAWVCVSDEFDIFKISKIIFQAVAGDNKDFANLDLLQVALQEKLSKKRFLLVLDDVWNENMVAWEQLLSPFHVGAPGSKIIVTTRSLKVVPPHIKPHDLQLLSHGESLSLLAQHALRQRNFEEHPDLKSHGEGIVKKCERLPLALIALGRVLSTKSKAEEWEEILNSDIWSSQEEKSEVLPALRLSYHHLPSHLKQLFAYCSLFPKDYVFEKDELVLLWMAEGFLPKSKEENPVEDLGVQYFEELLYRSFFWQSPNEESRYIMHDLINDLAKYVAGKFFLRLDEKVNGVEGNEALEKFRHFSFLRQEYGVYKKFEAFCGAKRLRTFFPVSVNPGGRVWGLFYLSNKVLVDLLPQLQLLRVLSLSHYHSIREVPNSICDLKHLRYLNFSHTQITRLPEQVCQLYNLQTLLMRGCYELAELPVSFAKLINLRHLDISGTSKLKKMPLGVGGLTSLRTLSKVMVEGDDGFKITELKGLKALRGRLSIEGLHKVVNTIHAKEASLLQKKGLDHLSLEWKYEFDDSRVEAMEYGVLEALRPHSNLRKLEIVSYGGNKFPDWIGDPSFAGLTKLGLYGCRNCTSLPSVGRLPSLRELSVVGGMDAVKSVGLEILGASSSSLVILFPLLEVLEFGNMKGWEKWSINGGVNSVFPCLRKLKIEDCPNLGEVSIQSLPSLGVLWIIGCQEVVLRSVVEVTSCVTKLYINNVVGLTQLDGGMMEHLGAVEDLEIRDCKEVRYLWGSLSEACRILVKLRKLEVRGCGELVCLGEREKEEGGNWREGNNLTSLRELNVWSCAKIECLFGQRIEEEKESLSSSSIFPHLESLNINRCSGMKSLFSTEGGGGQQLPSTLKTLKITECENLLLEESVVTIGGGGGGGGGGENHNSTLSSSSSSSSLENLEISSLPNSKLFLERGGREGRFIHLTKLYISNCQGIESFPKMTTTTTTGGGGFLPKGLRKLSIWDCKNLKSFPDEELQTLTSLVDMAICNCPSLDSAFPRGLWPPNLSRLWIGRLKKPISEWGPQNLPTSLVDLSLIGDESIAEVVGSSSSSTPTTTTTTTTPLHLPTSLSKLELLNFKNLELISKGLQHLTSLEELKIHNCPKLRDLPETLLPWLSRLTINNCPKLKERCITRRTRRDSYYPLISGIPYGLI